MGNSMPNGRLEFGVQRDGEEALVTMDCGHGVIRARSMPSNVLSKLGEMCEALLSQAKTIMPSPDDAPEHPKYLRIASCSLLGICHATMGVHRTETGDIEKVIAFYDEGDDSAPVLVLVEEQIDEFLSRI